MDKSITAEILALTECKQLSEHTAHATRLALHKALAKSEGIRAEAARILGISRPQIFALLAEYPDIAEAHPTIRGHKQK